MIERKQTRLQGNFQLPGNGEVFGELLLRGPNTLLTMTSKSELPPLKEASHLFGATLDGKKVTCIDCLISTKSSQWMENQLTHQSAKIFPHYVIVGVEHVDPTLHVVQGIDFRVDDLMAMFYDFDAFGYVTNAKSVIDTVLAERRRIRPVEAGENPIVAYYSGKMVIFEVDTDIGILQVNHRPSFDMGGPHGILMKNRIVVSIEPHSPVTFAEAIDRVMIVTNFLSLVAGRKQGVYDTKIRTAKPEEETWQPASVYWSHAPKLNDSSDSYFKPHPVDVPLNPLERPEEFYKVIKDWIRRDTNWHRSRSRYINCLGKSNYYDADRLIAAANMFDILPEDAVPTRTTLNENLAKFQTDCLKILKKVPPSVDRDSVISALKRMGEPSLPKKIQYRTSIIEKNFGFRFEALPQIVKIAVQTRNYFVHGPSDDFDYSTVEPFLCFLTDALEFIFAASDLIEAGWDAALWNSKPHGRGHSFSRFKNEYALASAELKRAIARSRGK